MTDRICQTCYIIYGERVLPIHMRDAHGIEWVAPDELLVLKHLNPDRTSGGATGSWFPKQ
jgi:hypothetical protein